MRTPWQNLDGAPIVDETGAIVECDDCPCEDDSTCVELNTNISGLELNFEFQNLTIGTTTGCSCASIPLSGIVDYSSACSIYGGIGAHYCLQTSLGCNRCYTNSFSDTSACSAALRFHITCAGDVVSVQISFGVGVDIFLEHHSWILTYQTSFALSEINAGAVTVPLTDSFLRTTVCRPTAYLSSNVQLTITTP